MMEEVSDDTNGESTFEFVENKNVEQDLKEIPSNDGMKNMGSIPPATTVPLTLPSAPPSVPYTPRMPGQSDQTSVSASIFTPHPLMQPPPQVLPPPPQGPFAETQNWNPYPYTPPVSQQPITVLDPGVTDYSVAMPTVDIAPNVALPECNEAGGGVWGWIKGNQLLNKVAEKAKSSVDSVITTLDPGMKEIINTGGDINVIVASESEAKVSAVREAFQHVFGKATVQGIAVQSSSIAPQPVGVSAGLKAAEERINNLKQQGCLEGNCVVLAVENFITELTPDNWFDMGCLLLQDFNSGISLQLYTQAIPVSSLYVAQAKDQTPADYPLGWSGHAVTIGQVIASALGVHHSEWHEALTGVPRREMLFLAAKSIAGLYRSHLRR